MTREQSKEKLWKAHFNGDNPIRAMDSVIDQIYNDHEAQLEAKDEEIGLWKAEFRRMQDIAINKDVALEKALEEIKELKDEQ